MTKVPCQCPAIELHLEDVFGDLTHRFELSKRLVWGLTLVTKNMDDVLPCFLGYLIQRRFGIFGTKRNRFTT